MSPDLLGRCSSTASTQTGQLLNILQTRLGPPPAANDTLVEPSGLAHYPPSATSSSLIEVTNRSCRRVLPHPASRLVPDTAFARPSSGAATACSVHRRHRRQLAAATGGVMAVVFIRDIRGGGDEWVGWVTLVVVLSGGKAEAILVVEVGPCCCPSRSRWVLAWASIGSTIGAGVLFLQTTNERAESPSFPGN